MPTEKQEKRSLSRDIAGVFSARLAWMALGQLCGILLARWLGPHDRGLLALVILVPATSVTFVKLGISQSNVYFANRERVPIEKVASNAVTLALLSGVCSAGLVWMFGDLLLGSVLKGVPLWALGLAVVRIPLLLIDDYLYGVLQATGDFPLYNKRQVFGEVLRLILVVVTVVLLDGGLFAAIAVQTFVTIVNVGWLMWRSHRRIRFRLRFDLPLLRRQLRFGFKSYVQTLVSHLLFRADLFLVSYFLSRSEVAFYSIAQRFPELLLEIPQAVGLVLYPRLASVPKEEVHRLTARACRRTLMILVPFGLFVVVVGEFLITLLYGQPYAPAAAPLPWTTAGVVMIALYLILTRDFTSRNLQQVNTLVGLLALVSNFSCNLVLIPRLGIVGAAISVCIAYSGACTLLLLLYLRASKLTLREVVVPTGEDLRFFRQRTRQGWDRGRQFIRRKSAGEKP